MNRTIITACVALSVSIVGARANAQTTNETQSTQAGVDSRVNAAEVYQEVAFALRQAEARILAEQPELNPLVNGEWTDETPMRERKLYERITSEAAVEVERAVDAALNGRFDSGVDYTVESRHLVDLDYLRAFRNLVRIIAARARLDAHDGDSQGATTFVLAQLAMARQVASSGQTMIELWAADEIIFVATEDIVRNNLGSLLTVQDRIRLSEEIESLREDWPEISKRVIRDEEKIVIATLKSAFGTVSQMSVLSRAMHAASVDVQVREVEAAIDRIVELWGTPGATEKIEEIETEPTGLAGACMPGCALAHKFYERMMRFMDQAITKLRDPELDRGGR